MTQLNTKRNARGKRRGFTLVELLVAIACGSLVLVMVAGCIVFITKTNKEVIDTGERHYKVQIIYDSVVEKKLPTAQSYKDAYLLEDRKIYCNGEAVVNDTDLESIAFYDDERLIHCILTFPDEEFRFVVGNYEGE